MLFITSNRKSYQLSLGKNWSFGGSVNVGAQFFNVAAASFGLSGQYGKAKEEVTQSETTETLSQEYGVIGKLKIPPKSKMKARITTWAVTYEATTTAELSIPNDVAIPVRFRSVCTLCPTRRVDYLYVRVGRDMQQFNNFHQHLRQ